MGALALQLQELMARGTNAKLNEDELALLRQLMGELKTQQQQAEMRDAQIAWLQAEAKRARLAAVLEARYEIEQLHEEALQADRLIVPIAPIAAAEDAFSIAVDWVAPASDAAARYHLQWRSEDDRDWISSAASEKINVPCCTKGHLRTQLVYRFRVRAADKDGRWGPWSKPSQPTSPSVALSSVPSRPQLRPLTKGRLEARWSPPEGVSASGYELQWRQCNGQWDEPGSSLECAEVVTSTPSLNVTDGLYYTFRVRASIERYRGVQWTEWSPPSAPTQPYARHTKTNGGAVSPKGDGKGRGSKKDVPPKLPLRTDEDATESVIEADLRGALSGYHPSAQAAVEAKLAQVKQQRAEDEGNLKTLEERNRAIALRARDEQLNELVRLKREMLSRAAEQNGPMPPNGTSAATAEPEANVTTDSWD